MDTGTRLRMFWRSLFLQACWNYERMQSLGFAYCLEPWLESLHEDDPQAVRDAMRRHLEYFNTQPYMASFVLGVIARLEEDLANAPAGKRAAIEARIGAVKRSFGASLAGIGDAVFWGALKPGCAALAILAALVLWTLRVPHAVPLALAVYLATYNIPALWVRWEGLGMGYEEGDAGVAMELKRFRWQERLRRLRWTGLGMTAALVAAGLLVSPWGDQGPLVHLGAFAAGLCVRPLGYPSPRLYAVVVAGGVLAALAGA